MTKNQTILNLTQHPASAEQVAAGVYNLEEGRQPLLKEALTFEELPTDAAIRMKVSALVAIAASTGATAAMIGGAPYLMAPLERALHANGVKPLYAFSRRESVEVTGPDGSVRKTAVFRHLGFVEAVRAF